MAKRGRKPGTPQQRQEALARQRERQKRYSDKITALGQDIGEIPPPKDPERRKRATDSFRVFCEVYFPKIFFLKWSRDLLRVIGKIELVVLNGETLAIAMPRGSGKTTLCQVAALWAVITGRHPFVILISATAAFSRDAISWFKAELSTNELLRDDFPEVVVPIFKIENDGRRCRGQRHKGKRTNIGWTADRIVFPTIEGSAASGTVIDTASLEGNVRGGRIRMPDGRVVRPTLALCDDPQTRESSKSQGPAGQTTFRLKVINEDVQGLAGPDRRTAILVPCTVITPGDLADQLCNRREYPNYRGERTKRFYSWPTNKKLWEEYRELRDELLRSDQPLVDATEFYRSHQATCGRAMDDPPTSCATCQRKTDCMDCGAQVDWAARIDSPDNLSAVQAAMHKFYELGPAGFASEFQNEPLTSELGEQVLTAEVCASRFNGRRRGEIPLACTELTMGIDVQKFSLWWVISAWEPNFTGYVVDYGIWPRQARQVITAGEVAESALNLATAYPGRGEEGTIQAGLEDLIQRALARDFPRAGDGGNMRITRMLVDSGNWASTIAAVKHRIGGSVMLLSKGRGIRAGHKPLSTLKRHPGERHGDHWYTPSTQGTREFPHVAIDTNYWKSRSHSAWLTAPGDPGALTLFGDNAVQHSLFAAHQVAEYFVWTEGYGRKVQEWNERPNRPDQHWFDAAVLTLVAASYQGIVSPSQAQSVTIRRPHRSFADLQAAARERKAMA